ncbi:MAG: class II D-tagatose-bisphosphate aldolase, non-catalytic subunit, partial [Clostridia bacterium]|nr:class II D-tagatose-bisphosphate aldolase, non-catalytic subunit [Clostridia bacterium]
HLGPLTWQSLDEAAAMEKAEELVRDYVRAGFTKIHIDTSMRVADDSREERLSDETIARRGAHLAAAAEDEFASLLAKKADAVHPIYCIGSEVPIPGGAQEAEDSVAVTEPEAFVHCVEAFRAAFVAAGAESAWPYVTGVVVQPGVEFGDEDVIEYNAEKATDLIAARKAYEGIVFEGHSTDYQTKYGLREMVRDGIVILKVGPALTFALREGLFALAQMESALIAQHPELTASNYIDVMEAVMMENDGNWRKYYHGDAAKQAFKRKYSFSDRCRYYLPDERLKAAEATLLANLNAMKIPVSLLSQFMPIQYTKVREGALACTAEALLGDRVENCIDEYLFAVGAL